MSIDTSLIQKIYIAYFNRPADVAGLKYWLDEVNANRITLGELAQSFSQQDEFKKNYAGKDHREIVSSLYKNLFGREPDKAGLDYWVSELTNNKLQLGGVALAILQGAKPESDDGQIIANKTRYAEAFTLNLAVNGKESSYTGSQNFTDAKTILSGVGKDFYASSGSAGSGLVTKLTLANGVSGVNSENITQEMTVEAELNLRNAKLGDTLELSLGGSSFPVRLSKTLSLDDLAKKTIKFTIPANQNWGEEGLKTLAVRSLDSSGKPLKEEQQLNLNVSLSKPEVPKTEEWTTAWAKDGNGGVNQIFSSLKFDLSANKLKNGWISLQHGALELAKIQVKSSDTLAEFKFDAVLGKQIYDLYAANKLSLSMQDAAGNKVSANLSDTGFTHKIAHVPTQAPKNIKVQLIGGSDTDGAVSAETVNLLVTAEINGLQAFSGSASLRLNGVVIARDLQIDANDQTLSFDLNAASNKGLLSVIKSGGELTVSLKDHNNNLINSEESYNLKVSQALLTNTPGTTSGNGTGNNSTDNNSSNNSSNNTNNNTASQAVTNLLIETLGGVKQANLLNSSNTGFKVTANIPVGIANGEQAYLSLDGKVIAYDYDISASDNKVSFEVNFKSNDELQKAISKGGVLSVTVNTKTGVSLLSTTNPTLKVDYKTPVANTGIDLSAPSDIRAYNSFHKTDISNWTDSIGSDLAIQAKIKVGQASNGYAELKLNGVVIARDTQIKSGDTTVDFSLDKYDLKLRKILLDNNLKSGQLSVSVYDSRGNVTESQSKLPFTISLSDLSADYFTPFMTGINKFVHGVVQMKLEPTRTETEKFVKEYHVYPDYLPANVAKAELLRYNEVIATDNSVKQGDKVIDFSFTPIWDAWVTPDANIRLYDQAGQVIETTSGLYFAWTSLGSAALDLSPVAPSNVSFNAVGGIVVPNKLNASNTGFSVTADIPATTESGVRAELYWLNNDGYAIGTPLATLNDIKVGSTSLNFDVNEVRMKSLTSGSLQGVNFKVLLFNAAGEASVAKSALIGMDFRAPSQPVKGWLLDKANGTKELMVGIISGQMPGGKASLVLDGKEIASDTTIAKSDSVVQFSLDSNLAASILNSINEGKVSLNLSDSFANASSVNLHNLKLETTVAANADLLGPDLAAANPMSHVKLGNWGVGDTFTLRFNEPTQKNISFADILQSNSTGRIVSADFGRNASMVWNADGTELTITLGSLSSLGSSYGGEALILVGLKDLAGNASELVFPY